MAMKVSKCKKFVTVRESVGGQDRKVHTLTMFNSVIFSIIEGVNGANLKRKLLAAPAFRFSADKGDVVYSVQKLCKFELTMSCQMVTKNGRTRREPRVLKFDTVDWVAEKKAEKALKFREEELLKREKEVNEVKKVSEKEKMHEKDRGRHYRFEREIGQ